MTVQPILLLDMDGPLADFDAHFWRESINAGCEFDVDGPADQTARFASDHISNRVQRGRARTLTEQRGWFRDLPLVDGAAEGVDLLSQTFEVWIVTKPLESNPWCRDDKAAWVRDHLGSDWERRLIVTPDKSLVTGHVLLDDAPHLAWLDRAHWTPVIFKTPWNGAGSRWDDLRFRWTWGDDPGVLLKAAMAVTGW